MKKHNRCIKCRSKVKDDNNLCRLCLIYSSKKKPTCRMCHGVLDVPSWSLCEACDGTSIVNKFNYLKRRDTTHTRKLNVIKVPLRYMDFKEVIRLYTFEHERHLLVDSDTLLYDENVIIGYKTNPKVSN